MSYNQDRPFDPDKPYDPDRVLKDPIEMARFFLTGPIIIVVLCCLPLFFLQRKKIHEDATDKHNREAKIKYGENASQIDRNEAKGWAGCSTFIMAVILLGFFGFMMYAQANMGK